ncbi:RNA methyltransferase, TrmH family [Eubacterium ruminantium]|nr:RNA methyltransferase, TrmH family [Eubacterium ruminantium]
MITSTSNDKIKYVEKLKKSASFRREEGCFPVEGIRMVREIPAERIRELYITEKAYVNYREEIKAICITAGFSGGNHKAAEESVESEQVHMVSDTCMKKMSDTETPQGVLAVVRASNYTLEDILIDNNESDGKSSAKAPLLLVLEKLQDPGNMGTIFRTAEAAGVTGLIISGDSADVYNPKVIRSTMGAIFRMKFYISNDLVMDMKKLKEKGIKVYAMHLLGESFYDKDFRKPTAFLIGNEGNGLSDRLSAEADERMKIPMMGSVESLNAAVSASVVAYEALRQRIV